MRFRLSVNFVTLALYSLSLPKFTHGESSDPCSALLKYDLSTLKVPAADAYACLHSPPFDKARSAEVHEQMKRLLYVLSSQAFFNQPKGLPLDVNRVDLNGTLDAIKKKIDNEEYENDYQFNRDFTELFGGYHDGHTYYAAQCMSDFGSFKHEYPLVSIVPPGEDTPRIYLADEATGEVLEEVVKIAGEPALEHLLKLVKSLKGTMDVSWIDADARWNALFVDRGALENSRGNFADRELYPGEAFEMETISGGVIKVDWYVNGPGTFDDPELWKVHYKDTETFVKTICVYSPPPTPPTEEDPTEEDPEQTLETPEDDTEEYEETTEDFEEPEGYEEMTEDPADLDEEDEVDLDEEDEVDLDEEDEEDDNSDEEDEDTDDTDYDMEYVPEDSTEDITYESASTVKETSLKDHHRKGHVKSSTKHHARDLEAQDDGSTVGDYSSLELTDLPPVSYPQVATRLNGTEQSLAFLEAYPDVAVWGIHSFASRNNPAPDALPESRYFLWYWRHYMIENLKLLKKRGVKRLIIDMSTNGGGSVVLGMETVRRFFPEADPFYAVDYRRTPLVEGFLHITNTSFEKLDGTPYESLDEFFDPPVAKRGDYFTKIGRFDEENKLHREVPGVKFNTGGDPPFAIEDVVILTDGQCGSTCAIVTEALSNLGVATVVTGGQPSETKPKKMQAVGGIKGYQVLNFQDMFVISDFIRDKLTAADSQQYNKYLIDPVGINLRAAVNLRNSYNPEDLIIPTEFLFQPADGHLWYTKQMLVDRTILWNDVVKLTWDSKGENKLIKARTEKPKDYKGSNWTGKVKGGLHQKQPKAGYRWRRTKETFQKGVAADLKYLASGWLGGWGGKK